MSPSASYSFAKLFTATRHVPRLAPYRATTFPHARVPVYSSFTFNNFSFHHFYPFLRRTRETRRLSNILRYLLLDTSLLLAIYRRYFCIGENCREIIKRFVDRRAHADGEKFDFVRRAPRLSKFFTAPDAFGQVMFLPGSRTPFERTRYSARYRRHECHRAPLLDISVFSEKGTPFERYGPH